MDWEQVKKSTGSLIVGIIFGIIIAMSISSSRNARIITELEDRTSNAIARAEAAERTVGELREYSNKLEESIRISSDIAERAERRAESAERRAIAAEERNIRIENRNKELERTVEEFGELYRGFEQQNNIVRDTTGRIDDRIGRIDDIIRQIEDYYSEE